MLINNNDRNEDNWGIIKYKKENEYNLAPIYDCGNCFYGKSSDEKIGLIMSSEERLNSSALNGITAYEDDNGERITNIDIIKYIEKYNPKTIERVVTNIKSKLNNIKDFINSIPNKYKNIDIISDVRKNYYFNTLMIRLDSILK